MAEDFLMPKNIVGIVDASMLMKKFRCLPSAELELERDDVRTDPMLDFLFFSN